MTGGPVGFQTPSPGSGCGKTGLIGGGQAAVCDFGELVCVGALVRAGFSPTVGRVFSCGPPVFGAFTV